MEDSDFNELAGRDDALYRTLGLLIRHLDVRNIIEAPDLVREMRLLAGQLDGSYPQQRECIAGMAAIAAAIEGEQPQWSEARAVAELYRGAHDAGR